MDEIEQLKQRLAHQELATLAMQIQRDEAMLEAFRVQGQFINNEAPRVEASLAAAKAIFEQKRAALNAEKSE